MYNGILFDHKKIEILFYASTETNLKDIMQDGINQPQKNK
jgi:hypothetical protein